MSKTLVGATVAVALTAVICPSASAESTAARQAMTWYGQGMEQGIRNGSTPHVTVIGQNGRVSGQQQFGYGTHKPGVMNVTGLGKAGLFRVLMLLPVSGHVGWESAQKYARENSYNVRLQRANGAVWNAPRIASTGLVTPAELELTLSQGKNILDFWADGSAGAGGYIEGRRFEITWDGN
jgi:hypothetical protein